jgi:chitodextrinase
LRCSEGYPHDCRPEGGFGWANTEVAYYGFGSSLDERTNGWELSKNVVNKANIVTSSVILNTYTAPGGDNDKGVSAVNKGLLKRGISADDQWLSAYTGQRDFGRRLTCRGYMRIQLNRGFTPAIADYWGVNRDCYEYGGHDRSRETRHHSGGIWSYGLGQDYIHILYSGDRIFFQLSSSGSDSDSGPKWEDWDGNAYGANEIIPISSGFDRTPIPPGFHHNYWGHPSIDRWEKYILWGDGDPTPGTRVTLVDEPGTGFDGGLGRVDTGLSDTYEHEQYDGRHHAWDGWTDYVVFFPLRVGDERMEYRRIYCRKIDFERGALGGRAFAICSTHLQYQGNYNAYPRPSQSPDGTKVAFAAHWLNSSDAHPYLCYAVAYFPYPPTDLAATWDSGVKLSWLPPRYTTRGWPTDSDRAPYAREVRRYHVWRSTNQDNSWREIGHVAQSYEIHEAHGRRPVASDCTYIDSPGDGRWYYALTTEEWCGLESRELSEVLQVTVLDNTITDWEISAPKGQPNFWTTPPPAPLNFAFSPTGTPGHYRVNWTEPAYDKTRYYNIYYSTAGVPAPIQQNRIASVPVGTSTYLDWLADPQAQGYYAITTVDRQGNESAPAGTPSSDSQPPTAPTGLLAAAVSSSQISLTWNASTDNVGVVGYNVYRDGTIVGTPSTTNYSDTGLNPSTKYIYTVTARDAAGNESPASGQVSEETLPETADNEPPTAPTGLVATAVSSSQIDLAWNPSTDNVGVVGYNVYRDGTIVGTPATTGYADTGLTASTSYTYSVAARDAAGNESPHSSSVSEQTSDKPNQLPLYLGGTAENIALNRNVTATRSDYSTTPEMAVDGQGEAGNSWVATGTPNSAVVDLGQDRSIGRIKVNPFNLSSSVYYYDGSWNIKYATSSEPDIWLDFAGVVKSAGGGDLVGNGISIQNGDPGSRARNADFLFYDFAFTPVLAQFVRFGCTLGDEDNDTNLNEIQIYTAGEGIPDQTLPAGTPLQNVFDLDDYFTDPDGDVLTYDSIHVEEIDDPLVLGAPGIATHFDWKVTVVIDTENIVSFELKADSQDWRGQETFIFIARDGKGGTAKSDAVPVTVK